MKTTIARVTICAALLGLSLSTGTATAADTNLSIFAGKFKGNLVLTLPDGTVLKAKSKNKVKGPASGISTKMSYSARVGGLLQQTEISFNKDGTVFVTDLGVGIAGANNAHPGDGTYTQSGKRITFSATNGDLTLSGKVRVRDVGAKRLMKMNLVSSDVDGSYVYKNKLKAKLP